MSESVEKKQSGNSKKRTVIILILLLAILISLLTTFRESLFGPGGMFDFSGKDRTAVTHADSLRIADSLAKLNAQNDTSSQTDLSKLTAEQLQHLLDSLANVSYGTDPESLAQKARDQKLIDAIKAALAKLQADSKEKARLDSLKRVADSLSRVTYGTDSLSKARFTRDSLAKINLDREKARLDSLAREKSRLDSLAREKARLDSLNRASAKQDTVAPWIYPDPTGGLHYQPVKISFVISEPCSVYVHFSGESKFRLWDKNPISLAVNEELFYYGVDTAGNRSEIKSKKYVFEKDPLAGSCPDGMVLINSSADGFCIDKYEWPNRKGAKPTSNVSFSEASDSCFSKGKRLCTSNEWESACEGKYNWSYPYGSEYDQHSCVTQESSRKKSGEFGECRGWYAVHDMVGNLAEWTSTPAKQDKRFYIVKGGFWESGKGADCHVERYSYYPQNRHNPVGFRCCRDTGNK